MSNARLKWHVPEGDEEWEDYVKRLEEMVKEYDANQIKKDIQSLENIKIFFENIPL